MSKHLEQIDRRAFLRGLTLTSAGLLLPKVVQVFVPNEQLALTSNNITVDVIQDEIIAYCATDAKYSLAWYLTRTPEFLQVGPNSFTFVNTNLSNIIPEQPHV